MLDLGRNGRRWLLGSLALLGAPLLSNAAQARSSHGGAHAHAGGRATHAQAFAERRTGYGRHAAYALMRGATWHYGSGTRLSLARGAYRGEGVVQCVAFARADSGIELSGNAADWWDNASGLYARGQRPEAGSVLSFRANGHMRLGHVAVVTRVLDGRTVEIDHSHWMGRGVSRDMTAVDVSENNDWSAVRVELGHTGTYGSIYPTHGFIYDRPEHGGSERGATEAALQEPPAPVRIGRQDRRAGLQEVAEAPVAGLNLAAYTASSLR